MPLQTIVYITLALLVALGFAFFQYIFRKDPLRKSDYVFFGLRTVSVFLVLLMLINPEIRNFSSEIIKTELYLLKDDSKSTQFLKADKNIEDFVTAIETDKELQDRFEIHTVPFSNSEADSLSFSSNLYQELKDNEQLVGSNKSATLLISDGNQNEGRDFSYYRARENNSLYPVIFGDTTRYEDLSIDRINVNRYAFLKNKFPVEIFMSYSGDEEVSATLRLKAGGRTIRNEQLSFTSEDPSQTLDFEILAGAVGTINYTLELSELSEEKNILNNNRNFSIEVIDGRTKVLIVSSVLHPDLGALKKSIESNEQREVEIVNLREANPKIQDYQLVILYQPNSIFRGLTKELIDSRSSFLLLTGMQTDWNFINQLEIGIQKNNTRQPQDVFGIFNDNFSSFQFENIGFSDFPPLVDGFGEVRSNTENVLLYQRIQGVETEQPLIAIAETPFRFGYILGENIWRWRSRSYVENGSFESFDQFMGKIVQNLASNQKRDRLQIDYQPEYYSNEPVKLIAQYFDQNYQYDAEGDLGIVVEDSTSSKILETNFVAGSNGYALNLGSLDPGNYNFEVKERSSGVSENGSFTVSNFDIEQQNYGANLPSMRRLAENNETELYFQNDFQELKQRLLESDKLKPVQRSVENTVPLIDWYFLLFILAAFLAAEWFYRKYLGLI